VPCNKYLACEEHDPRKSIELFQENTHIMSFNITLIKFVASNPSINLLMNTKIELQVHLDGSRKCAMTINLIDYQCVSNKLHHKR